MPEILINSNEYAYMKDNNMKYPYINTNCNISVDFLNTIYTVETERGTIIRVKDETIYFDKSSSILDNKYLNALYSIKDFLNKNKDIHLIIEGHADNSGGELALAKNVEFSKARSLQIITILKNIGIDENRLISYHFSNYIPYYTNTEYNNNREERNRRVEFIMIKCKSDYNKYILSVYPIFYRVVSESR